MNAIRDGGRPDPIEGIELKVLELSQVRGVQVLILQARIEGRDRKFWLSLDNLQAYTHKDPVVVEALCGIHQELKRISSALEKE